MAKIKHISDGVNTWDVGVGTDVFSGDYIPHSTVKITVSGFTTGTYLAEPATIIDQSYVVSINFTNEEGTSTEYTDLDTLYSDLILKNYYEVEFVNNSGNAMPSNNVIELNKYGGKSIMMMYSPYTSFSGDDGPIGCRCDYIGDVSARVSIVTVTEKHYDKLKIIDPLEVKKINGVFCLTGHRSAKRFTLSCYGDEWKLKDSAGTAAYTDLRIGDIVSIIRSAQPLPNEVNVRSPYMNNKTVIFKQRIKYVSFNLECMVIDDMSYGAVEVKLQSPPVNYATSNSDAGANNGSFVTSTIRANSSESDIAAVLRGLKNVVEENDSYSNRYFMLYGYDKGGAITNFNKSIHRIVYDDGSFAAIYYPAAGTIPDGIRPGFTLGAGHIPPDGEWNPRITYDSMFFYSDSTKCSFSLNYNGKGFYGTPANGTDDSYTHSTNYIITFGHFNNQYMDIN